MHNGVVRGKGLLSKIRSLHRITDKRFESTAVFSTAVASEVVAITYLFSSVFTGTQRITDEKFYDDYSLIASIGARSREGNVLTVTDQLAP
ncbi:hypothetical protein [Legionella fallonii]|uniref:Uncharacterized protein n=1 Tax=Legionella fallonii LLAP-10 TaxID=1212491 RepID=A0A098G885_9GAMM|nr:hypothetical protein [Legionella fallonii]CEG58196.1 protein of unknown function [Legionella fallonii LLAP-10]